MRTTRDKILLAVGTGFLVAVVAFVINIANLGFDRTLVLRLAIGDLIAGVFAALMALAVQLSYDGMYYRVAMERAAIVAEMNHHVRNAVFPLCLAVHRKGDPETDQLARETVDRINVALRDAMTDAFTRDNGVIPISAGRNTAA